MLPLTIVFVRIASVATTTEMPRSNNNQNFERFLVMQLSIHIIAYRRMVCRLKIHKNDYLYFSMLLKVLWLYCAILKPYNISYHNPNQ